MIVRGHVVARWRGEHHRLLLLLLLLLLRRINSAVGGAVDGRGLMDEHGGDRRHCQQRKYFWTAPRAVHIVIRRRRCHRNGYGNANEPNNDIIYNIIITSSGDEKMFCKLFWRSLLLKCRRPPVYTYDIYIVRTRWDACENAFGFSLSTITQNTKILFYCAYIGARAYLAVGDYHFFFIGTRLLSFVSNSRSNDPKCVYYNFYSIVLLCYVTCVSDLISDKI